MIEFKVTEKLYANKCRQCPALQRTGGPEAIPGRKTAKSVRIACDPRGAKGVCGLGQKNIEASDGKFPPPERKADARKPRADKTAHGKRQQNQRGCRAN